MHMVVKKVSLQIAGAVRIRDLLRLSEAAGHKETVLGLFHFFFGVCECCIAFTKP